MKTIKVKVALWLLNYVLNMLLSKIEFKKVDESVETIKNCSGQVFKFINHLVDALRDGKLSEDEAKELFKELNTILKDNLSKYIEVVR